MSSASPPPSPSRSPRERDERRGIQHLVAAPAAAAAEATPLAAGAGDPSPAAAAAGPPLAAAAAAAPAKAICYLSHDTTGAANGVTISLTGADPRMKYTGSHKGTKRQLAEGVLGSQARRSTDIGTIVPRTQPKRALK